MRSLHLSQSWKPETRSRGTRGRVGRRVEHKPTKEMLEQQRVPPRNQPEQGGEAAGQRRTLSGFACMKQQRFGLLAFARVSTVAFPSYERFDGPLELVSWQTPGNNIDTRTSGRRRPENPRSPVTLMVF